MGYLLVKQPKPFLVRWRVSFAAGVLRVSSKLGSSHRTLTTPVEAYAPPCVINILPFWRGSTNPRGKMLASEAFFHGAFDLAVCRLFGDLTPLVVLTLAACDSDLELDDSVLGIELEGDEGLPLFLALADEAVDLLSVQQQLAVAGGELPFLSGVRVRRDVRPDQEDFAVPHPGIALLEVGPALPDGLYFGPCQLDAGFIGLLYGKVVESFLVSREVCHSRFTTLSSARCMSGRTSSNSTRTLSPTL